MHHAQAQLQKIIAKENAAKRPSDSNHHFIGDQDEKEDDDDYEEEEWADDYFQDVEDGKSPESDQKTRVEDVPATKLASDTAVSATPSPTETKSTNNASSKDVSNTGGNIVSSSYLTNYLAREVTSPKSLFPVRQKPTVHLPSDVSSSANLRSTMLQAGLITPKKAPLVRQTFERPTTPRRATTYRVPTPVDCSVPAPQSSVTEVTAAPPMGALPVNIFAASGSLIS